MWDSRKGTLMSSSFLGARLLGCSIVMVLGSKGKVCSAPKLISGRAVKTGGSARFGLRRAGLKNLDKK
jgi:hypothetical protein